MFLLFLPWMIRFVLYVMVVLYLSLRGYNLPAPLFLAEELNNVKVALVDMKSLLMRIPSFCLALFHWFGGFGFKRVAVSYKNASSAIGGKATILFTKVAEAEKKNADARQFALENKMLKEKFHGSVANAERKTPTAL